MNKAIAAVVTSALGLGLLAVAAPAAEATTKHTAHIDCSSPKDARSNYSWADGINTVTVYFNNHCSGKVSAGIVVKDVQDGRLDIYCMVTNGGTKGKKKFDIGAQNTVYRIQNGCSL
jgi:lipopolysaccharide export LptBFGC system permease protein LptF